MAVLKAYRGTYYLWKYLPSQIASIIFLVLFTAITILHCWRMHKHRSWFCIPFVIGCFCELLGFASRIAAYPHTDNIVLYVLQVCFLIIAPVFFAASIYMTLSRIIRAVKAEHLSPIPIKRLTPIFIVGDLISLNVQSGASGLTSDVETAETGETIIIAGIAFQLVLLGFFLVVAAMFQMRLRKAPTTESITTGSAWRKTLYMVYTVSVLIFLRSVFRMVEFVQGREGYLLGTEWPLHVFESVPMFAVTVAFWYWYPGFVQPPVRESDSLELVGMRGKLRRRFGLGL